MFLTAHGIEDSGRSREVVDHGGFWRFGQTAPKSINAPVGGTEDLQKARQIQVVEVEV